MKLKKWCLIVGLITCFLLLVVFGCNGDDTTTDPKYSGKEYGIAYGHNGDIFVEITMLDGVITEVVIIENYGGTGYNETPEEGDPSLANWKEWATQRIKDRNTWDIDNLAGATVTIHAVREAAQEAIDKIIAAGG